MILDVRPDIYKLDRYLVSGAWNDRYRQVILDSLARMVRRLEARAVAEGVETSEELEAVRAAGIDLVQGFYFSRPLTYEDLVQTGYLDRSLSHGSPGVSAPRVLVLDDDPTVQQLLRTYFGGLGWSVQSCGDPANAMASPTPTSPSTPSSATCTSRLAAKPRGSSSSNGPGTGGPPRPSCCSPRPTALAQGGAGARRRPGDHQALVADGLA